MLFIRTYIYTFCSFMIAAVLLVACDDIIEVDTGTSEPVLNIDAWVNDKEETQVITLTFTQDYFDNTSPVPGVRGASVTLTDDQGGVYIFQEDTASDDGSYRWRPDPGMSLGRTGTSYTLTVEYNGETFVASSKMGRVPAVDSITFSKQDDMGPPSNEDFYQAEFWAKDIAGTGDTYWIRTYKNGSLLNKASEINIAYDAAQSAGSEFDGVTFITPIRKGINANDEDEQGEPVSSLDPGDSVYVEIHSITLASFNYLNEVIDQTDRNGGLSELFTSTPLTNVSTNMVNLNANGSPVVGFFNVASVSGLGRKFR
jgi:hypothetical protein